MTAAPGAIVNHLWQSTVFAVAVALLAFAFRKNRAQVRYWLWFSASLKFLVPFLFLISLGKTTSNALAARSIVLPVVARSTVSLAVFNAAEPFSKASSFAKGVSAPMHARDWVPIAIVALWACGLLAIAFWRFRGWLRVRAAVRTSAPVDISAAVEVRSSTELLEPGVVGLFRPTLLLPAGISERLTPSQLEAVLAHELSHIRRRDNLTAAIHMSVEALFWFHPAVWWIGSRLVEEREHACDEAVLSLGNEPRDYAEAILSVCKHYVESPLGCVSGVTGARINQRIQAILMSRVGGKMNWARKTALAIAAFAALGTPIVVGAIIVRPAKAQATAATLTSISAKPTRTSAASADGVAIAEASKPERPSLTPGRTSTGRGVSAQGQAQASAASHLNDSIAALGTVTAASVIVTPKADGELISFNFKEGELVQKGQLIGSIQLPVQQMALERAQDRLRFDQAELATATADLAKHDTSMSEQLALITQLKKSVEADQISLQDAQRESSLGELVAPMTGVAGFHLVDPGNVVHAGQPLVVINQQQPISVLFGVDAALLPRALALLRNGGGAPVEVWSRDPNAAKIATGRLVAADNEIDQATQTVRLRGEFDNKDGALFPNEFVTVHMFLNPR
jgi:RND family efflux transporter MFP subunit